VNDTSGQGLFDVLQDELKSLELDINNVRGQGYDNGSNMKGKHQGVQRKLLNVNPRAFYSAYGCHSLNLTLCDMANSCCNATEFFGIIQRIYTTFANSTKRWKILKDNITGLTLKSLSATRWESRVESVKAIRFQMSDIREALLQVAESDKDPLTSSVAKSLAEHELGDFEFIVSIVIWYEIFYYINGVSKQPAPSMPTIETIDRSGPPNFRGPRFCKAQYSTLSPARHDQFTSRAPGDTTRDATFRLAPRCCSAFHRPGRSPIADRLAAAVLLQEARPLLIPFLLRPFSSSRRAAIKNHSIRFVCLPVR
jgi:hypothetical protein